MIFFWMCRERDSNPHSHSWPRDFKSLVSTIPPSRLKVVQRYGYLSELPKEFTQFKHLVAYSQHCAIVVGLIADELLAFLSVNNNTKIVQVVGTLALSAPHPLSVVGPCERIFI